ncbi:MAG: cytidine deaminase [Thermomicrobia bacterium]|nr:cytidine deaminase [Thermomicrobia bacterium]
MHPEQEAALIAVATDARTRAYVPYSHYAVGAAILTADGQMHGGCNIENASYGLTSCAERNAIFALVSASAIPDARRIQAIAVVTAGNDPATPCGACRQVIREFGRDAAILIANTEGEVFLRTTLDALLPHSFGPEQLDSPRATPETNGT